MGLIFMSVQNLFDGIIDFNGNRNIGNLKKQLITMFNLLFVMILCLPCKLCRNSNKSYNFFI